VRECCQGPWCCHYETGEGGSCGCCAAAQWLRYSLLLLAAVCDQEELVVVVGQEGQGGGASVAQSFAAPPSHSDLTVWKAHQVRAAPPGGAQAAAVCTRSLEGSGGWSHGLISTSPSDPCILSIRQICVKRARQQNKYQTSRLRSTLGPDRLLLPACLQMALFGARTWQQL
jgi:hypothetical protein